MNRVVIAAAGALLVAAVGIPVAFAATLPVASSTLTTASVPVTVPASTCTPEPIADAALDRASQGSNYGNLGFLAVRAQNGNNQRRSLVKFDLASCSIPPTAVLESATLTVNVVAGPASSRSYAVHRVTEPWAETSVTYSTQPSFAAGATSTIATGTEPPSLSWPVLADVTAFVNGTQANEGWVVMDTDEKANPSVETILGARENGTASIRPTLVIGYYP